MKNRCGTAAVTGDDPLMNPLNGKCRPGRKGRGRTGSQKTCRQERVVFSETCCRVFGIEDVSAPAAPLVVRARSEICFGIENGVPGFVERVPFFFAIPKADSTALEYDMVGPTV